MSTRSRALRVSLVVGFFQVGCGSGVDGHGAAEEERLTVGKDQDVTAESEFEIHALDGVPVGSFARAINERGQVAGNTVQGGGETRAFVWDQGHVVDLGSLGGPHTYAWDINDEGFVVGVSEDEHSRQLPFIWRDGVMMRLFDGSKEPREGVAYGINNHGQVVGVLYPSRGDQGSHAFSWARGSFTRLDAPPGDGWTGSTAWDINDAGAIVGEVQNDQAVFAARWSRGHAVVLDHSAKALSEAALAINAFGLAVGRNTDAELGLRATSWSSEGAKYLAFESAMATAINDIGTIVGKHDMSTASRRAFVQTDGVGIDLHAATRDNPYASSEAMDIDCAGRIVGAAFRSDPAWDGAEAVIWTQVH
jgi:probable HAF family extracellular repeat protein